MKKVRTFATAFERESPEDDRLSEALGYGRECRMLHRVSYLADVQGSEKGQAARLLRTFRKFFQKNFRKNLEVTKKTPYLCKRFPAETGA